MNQSSPYTHYLMVFSMVVCLFSSCKKDRQHQPDPMPVEPSGLRSYGDAKNRFEFKYNSAGSVTELTQVVNSNATAYSINYESNSTIKMSSGNGFYKLSLANGRLLRDEAYNTNETDPHSSVEFSYAGDRITEQIFYSREDHGPQQYMKYQYDYSPTGDISLLSVFIRDVFSGQYQLLRTFKFEYDNHPNPLYGLNTFNLMFTAPSSLHNIVKMTSYDLLNNLTQTVNFVYTYKANGYPVTAERTLINTGASPEIDHLTYVYQ